MTPSSFRLIPDGESLHALSARDDRAGQAVVDLGGDHQSSLRRNERILDISNKSCCLCYVYFETEDLQHVVINCPV